MNESNEERGIDLDKKYLLANCIENTYPEILKIITKAYAQRLGTLDAH